MKCDNSVLTENLWRSDSSGRFCSGGASPWAAAGWIPPWGPDCSWWSWRSWRRRWICDGQGERFICLPVAASGGLRQTCLGVKVLPSSFIQFSVPGDVLCLLGTCYLQMWQLLLLPVHDVVLSFYWSQISELEISSSGVLFFTGCRATAATQELQKPLQTKKSTFEH